MYFRNGKKDAVNAMLSFWLLFSFLSSAQAMETGNREGDPAPTATARISVEKAWEVYHHAALGGTLSSPGAQSQLEANLHKSRALLAEAYDAEDQGDREAVKKLVNQIMEITKQVISGSQEPKR